MTRACRTTSTTAWSGSRPHWLNAARLGPGDPGRFHVGAAKHAVEDYFSHSNFVEVGLNSYIDVARHRGRQSAGVKQFLTTVEANGAPRKPADPGKGYVDTMFDASVPAPRGGGRRQAITTGSVGSVDMRASIGHILLPKVPALQAAIDDGIDRIFGLVKAEEVSSWAQIKATAGEARPLAALMALGDGLDRAGVTVPVPTLKVTYGRYIPIPFADDIDVPTDVAIVPVQRPATTAISSYIEFKRIVESTIDKVQSVLNVARLVAFPLVTLLKAILTQLQAMIDQALQDLMQLNTFLVRMLDTISGTDTVDQKNRTVGDALHEAHDAVEGFEQQTSLDARLRPGGDLATLSEEELEPVVGPVTKRAKGGWEALSPLPPSHSEIAKDHAPPEEHLQTHDPDHPIRTTVGGALDAGSNGKPLDADAQKAGAGAAHDHEEGSIFYGLARALATEADRHVMRQVELTWAESPGRSLDASLYGDRRSFNASTMEVRHDAFVEEAGGRAKEEQQRAGKDGYNFAQSDATNKELLARRPEARKLLDLADLIISHPDDAQWWRPIFETYISANPAEVARHIRERNAVRGARTTVGR